jgi:hypothetical protein
MDVYTKKFKKILDAPPWTEEEIAEMGPMMQAELRDLEKTRAGAEYILAHLEHVYQLYFHFFHES